MRSPFPLTFALGAAGLLAACSGNNPPLPVAVGAGWAWAPAVSGARPLPVLWNASATPTRLAVLPGGECADSGSAQAVALAGSAANPIVAGISSRCAGGVESMHPVTWGDTTLGGFALRELPLRAGETQGSALAVTVQGSDVYTGGATGGLSPLPALWKGSEISIIDTTGPSGLLPFGCDAGIVTGIGATPNYVVATGIVHCTSFGQSALAAVAWVLDPDLRVVAQGAFLDPPDGLTVSLFGPTVSMLILNDQLYSATAFATEPGKELPGVWIGPDAFPVQGTTPTPATIAVPTGISLSDLTPYLSGYARSGTGGPVPVVWGGSTRATLPVVDTSVGVGAGEAIVVDRSWDLVAGESLGRDPSDPSRFVSVPVVWNTGELQALGALSTAGAGTPVLLAHPLPTWWRLPGTPATAAADWPYPGGFGEVFAGRPVAAAGSGVVRALASVSR